MKKNSKSNFLRRCLYGKYPKVGCFLLSLGGVGHLQNYLKDWYLWTCLVLHAERNCMALHFSISIHLALHSSSVAPWIQLVFRWYSQGQDSSQIVCHIALELTHSPFVPVMTTNDDTIKSDPSIIVLNWKVCKFAKKYRPIGNSYQLRALLNYCCFLYSQQRFESFDNWQSYKTLANQMLYHVKVDAGCVRCRILRSVKKPWRWTLLQALIYSNILIDSLHELNKYQI